MKVTVLDTKTGETRVVEDEHNDSFQWADDNWSCDCNRCSYFGLDSNDIAIELGIGPGICIGERRFLVIAVENPTRDYYTLSEYNDGYPQELLDKHLPKQP